MSRSSLIEQLTIKRKSALEFEYDQLWAPPIMSIFTPQDIQELIKIATSIRYNGNINKKYELIDAIMKRRGFRKAHCGTNRVVYNFLESPTFVAKVAVDKVGMKDSPAEYINQRYFQPFCCKIFEVDSSGVLAFVERVNPISSIEEFISIADDVFNMMVTKIIGKYVVDDLGTDTYMNFGVRQNSNGYTFGPVIIDFPYVYELDGAKLKCQTPLLNSFTGMMEPCGGDIDYDAGFNHLICTKCGREYKAMDLAKDTTDIKFEYDSEDKEILKKIKHRVRTRLVDNGKVIIDSGRSTNQYISKEEFEIMNTNNNIPIGEMEVGKVIRKKNANSRETRDRIYTALQKQYYSELAKKNPNDVQRKVTDVGETVGQDYDMPIKHTNKTSANLPLGEMDVSESFDKNGNAVVNYDIDITTELEKATFPEITPDNKYAPSSIDNDEIENTLTEKLRKCYEETIGMSAVNNPDKPINTRPINNNTDRSNVVYTDEEVEIMAQAAIGDLENSRESSESASTILDAEADNDPTNSPITRPYAKTTTPISADYSVSSQSSYKDDKTVAEDAWENTPEYADFSYGQDKRSRKKRNKHISKKRRNKFDDDDDMSEY